MSTEKTKQPYVRARVTEEEKAEFGRLEKRAGLSESEFIRTACLTGGKVVFLEEGQEIAKVFCQIYSAFDYCMKSTKMDDKNAQTITGKLDEVSSLLYQVTERLTAIYSDEEEGDEYVNHEDREWLK